MYKYLGLTAPSHEVEFQRQQQQQAASSAATDDAAST